MTSSQPILGRLEWTDDALCTQFPTELWFPGPGVDQSPARIICAQCPVDVQCLALANSYETDPANVYEPQGIWGGLNPSQRIRSRRGRQGAAA